MTEEELIKIIGGIAGLISSITIICVFCRKVINKGFEPINNKIDKLDKNQCMNFLVSYLADVEKGVKKDDAETRRAYEVYDHYVKDLNGNSYIHDKWTRLMK